jgi:phosphohistidine phosphatase
LAAPVIAQKQLFVLRHAKSSWEDPDLADRDRPLAPRGRRAVKLLAGHVRAEEIEPGLVLCSPARRARETYDGVAPGGELRIEPGLYEATAEELIARLRQVPEEIESVMVIGHNPALHDLVLGLARADSDVVSKFPTGALATLRFELPWRDLVPGAAVLATVVRPRDLL